MRFRQIHLDFHTSEHIADIAARFSREQFQEALRLGHVDSVTCFAKCHHGWHYHPSEAGRTHPHCAIDLIGEQIAAAKAIDVNVPIYVSAGLDEQSYWAHPEWARRLSDGGVPWAQGNDRAGYHELCMNTGYLDYLVAEVEEIVARYDGDGIFLDIVSPRPCWCNVCVQERMADGADPRDEVAIARQARRTYLTYTRRIREAVDRHKPGLPVFHNGGHITQGDRELAAQNSHLELESLPTGGWGYDHFPLSAAYARNLGVPFLGMSGKFHFSWGEFGGYKHPNALRYEVAAAAAQGARFSVGDQLHPDGHMEEATYALVGAAYAELAAKEPWLVGATHRSEIGLLSAEAHGTAHGAGEGGAGQTPTANDVDAGVARVLNEGHLLYDAVDWESDFAPYRLLVLPDQVRLDAEQTARLEAYVAGGGRILATGSSGLDRDAEGFALDFGCRYLGEHEHDPDYVVPGFAVPPWRPAAFLVYGRAGNVELSGGEALAHRDPPWFNRDLVHFCSHRHSPNRREPGAPVAVAGPAGTWFAYRAFDIYARHGQQVLRDIVLHLIRRELGQGLVRTDLPTGGRVTVTRQEAEARDVVHLLYAQPAKRGSGVEVVEDIVPLHDVGVDLARDAAPSSVRLAPQGDDLPFEHADGRVSFVVPRVECHQMVVLAD